jgi:hypothetical protein
MSEANIVAILNVAPGSLIIDAQNNSKRIDKVPDNALELVAKGVVYLLLTPQATEVLAKWPLEKLEAMQSLRQQQGFKSDVITIAKAIDKIKSEELVAKSKK